MSLVPAPTSGIPWGRPPVPDVPVPPFADVATACSFVEQLALYIAALGGGAVTSPLFALLTMLDQELRRLRAAPFDAWPSPIVMRLAIGTYFPAPWTPRELNHTMGLVFRDDRSEMFVGSSSDTNISWSFDPGVNAARDDDGWWTVTQSERGAERVCARIAGDDDMVLYRMSDVAKSAFPFGWQYDEGPLRALDAAASAARSAFEKHATLPYITVWDEDLRRARDRTD